MSESKFPVGWNAARVKQLIDYYETLSEEGQVAEDEAATQEHNGQTVITVPDELLPAIRQLLAGHKGQKSKGPKRERQAKKKAEKGRKPPP